MHAPSLHVGAYARPCTRAHTLTALTRNYISGRYLTIRSPGRLGEASRSLGLIPPSGAWSEGLQGRGGPSECALPKSSSPGTLLPGPGRPPICTSSFFQELRRCNHTGPAFPMSPKAGSKAEKALGDGARPRCALGTHTRHP